MLVITLVALDSFWQTSSLSYTLEFEKKNHIVLQESRIDVRNIRKILKIMMKYHLTHIRMAIVKR